MFVPLNFNIWNYEPENLFLSFKGPFCPISHKHLLKSLAGARRFTVGLFSLHTSSLGQSHTKNAVTSRRTDNKVYWKSVKSSVWTATLSGGSQSRYSQRPHAMELSKVSEGECF